MLTKEEQSKYDYLKLLTPFIAAALPALIAQHKPGDNTNPKLPIHTAAQIQEISECAYEIADGVVTAAFADQYHKDPLAPDSTLMLKMGSVVGEA